MDKKEYDSILASAMAAEVQAQHLYADLAAKAKHAYLKSMFEGFVLEEQQHEKILNSFRAKGTGHIHFKGAPDFKVSETVKRPQVSANMKPADVIALAMKDEEDAMNHYLSLAQLCVDPEQKNVFQELAKMEREHKHKMENAFVDIGYPEVW